MSGAVSVAELQRAWAAVEAGQFRVTSPAHRPRLPTVWSPQEPVTAVAGAMSRVGTSTTTLAIAEASNRSVRVLECAPPHCSGLVAATTAELGITPGGWRRGRRGPVVIERTLAAADRVQDVPLPEDTDCDISLVDVSWNLAQVADSRSWVADVVVTSWLVIVTIASVPGLEALDVALGRADRPHHTWCVVIGPPLKKWPKVVQQTIPGRVRQAIQSGRVLTVGHHPSLAVTGLTAAPLPRPLLSACAPLLTHLDDHPKGPPDVTH
jgi:hypothetical protein